MKTVKHFALALTALATTFAFSIEAVSSTKIATQELIGELNPFDADIESQLNVYDQQNDIQSFIDDETNMLSNCYRASCNVWIRIVKSTQTGYLYINGALFSAFKVSTGLPKYETPNFDQHPNGRIYNKYSSTKYPGGDYNGLGNMPYAVFIRGGFAFHGTPKGNWSKLGKKASHGCIRMLPAEAKQINQLARAYGVKNVWVTVQN